MATLRLLLSSPRVAPGLLTRSAWQSLESADLLWAGDLADPLPAALSEAGLDVTTPYAALSDPEIDLATPHGEALARLLVSTAEDARVVWIHGPDGDPGLTDAIASEVSRLPQPPEVEVIVGSWDVPGSRLLDVVAVMDRLRSEGGCPWDAQQTHESLLPYLHEEAGEFDEAVRSGDREHMAEELGDVLLQVAFHARVAEDHPDQPFDIDEVAGVLVEKLVRRHPHVFAGGEASTPEEVEANWALIKEQERALKEHKRALKEQKHPEGEARGGPDGIPSPPCP